MRSNKQKASFLIIMCMGLVLIVGTNCSKHSQDNPLDPGGINYTPQYKTNVVFSDNFNSYGLNIAPSTPWINSYNGSFDDGYLTSPAIIRASGPDLSQAVQFVWSGSPIANDVYDNAIVRQSCNLSGDFFVKYDMQYIQGSMTNIGNMSFMFTTGNWLVNLIALGWQGPATGGGPNVIFYFTESGGYFFSSIHPLSGNWYTFKLEVNTSSKIVNFWYKLRTDQNFTLLAGPITENNIPSSINELCFMAQSPGSPTTYIPFASTNNIDNVEIDSITQIH